jgi:transmembrane sensor
VRAIGTAFTVHVRKIDVEVIVTEGTVEIDQPRDPELNAKVSIIQAADTQAGTQAGTPIKATAGSLVTFNKDLINDVEIMVASQLQKQLSWRQGMLVFKGEPLQMVVDEVSRYTNLKIIIPERSAREMKVGGLFKVGDTESLFEALRDGFDIHVQEVSDDVVYLISSENR